MNTERELIISIEDKRKIKTTLDVAMPTIYNALVGRTRNYTALKIREIALTQCNCMAVRKRNKNRNIPQEVYTVPRACQTCDLHFSSLDGDFCTAKNIYVRRKMKTCKHHLQAKRLTKH